MARYFLVLVLVFWCSTSAMCGTNAVAGREMEGDHFEGDIAMRSKPAAGGHGAMLAALRDTSKRWPGGKVPYRIDTDSIPNPDHHRLIRSAMDQISNKVTCIKFVENQKLARPKMDFIRIASDGDDKNSALGCWSYLGMVGGEQTLNLDGNCFREDLIVHELLHALSFIHEQNRSDRDNYVEIHNEHIKPGMESQFIKRNESDVNDNNTPYDFRSRLHYPPNAFSKSDKDTIVALYPGNDNFGPMDAGLSPIDIVEVSILYDCPVNNKDIIEYIHQNRLANEMRIEILDEDHFENMDEMNSKLNNVTSQLDNVNSELDDVKSEMNGMKSEMAELDAVKSEMGNVKSELENIKSQLAAILSKSPIMSSKKQDSSVVLLTGGEGSSKSVEVFGDCDINLPDLPVSRYDHSAHYFNGHVLLCGGNDAVPRSSCSVLIENTFEHHSNLVESRIAHVGVVLHDKLQLIGGYYDGEFKNSMETLTNSVMMWTKETSKMEVGRNRMCAVATSSTILLVIGGNQGDKVVEEYNSFTHKWRKRAPMLGSGRSGLSCVYLVESGQVLVAGGYNGAYLKTAQLYDVSSNKWSMAGRLNQERYMAEMVISNGRILILGGKSASSSLDSIEEFHPKNNSWTILETRLKRPRKYFAATVVPKSMFNC